MRATSELLEHTAEVKLRVRAPSFAELVAEAGRAIARLELGGVVPPAERTQRDLVIHGLKVASTAGGLEAEVVLDV